MSTLATQRSTGVPAARTRGRATGARFRTRAKRRQPPEPHELGAGWYLHVRADEYLRTRPAGAAGRWSRASCSRHGHRVAHVTRSPATTHTDTTTPGTGARTMFPSSLTKRWALPSTSTSWCAPAVDETTQESPPGDRHSGFVGPCGGSRRRCGRRRGGRGNGLVRARHIEHVAAARCRSSTRSRDVARRRADRADPTRRNWRDRPSARCRSSRSPRRAGRAPRSAAPRGRSLPRCANREPTVRAGFPRLVVPPSITTTVSPSARRSRTRLHPGCGPTR